MKIDKATIEKAARAIKVLKVAGSPGMDEIAIKLHTSSLTYDEQREAEYWAKAFELAAAGPGFTAIEIAISLREVMR